jgi:hypothetical protein
VRHAAVTLEAAELARLALHRAVGLLNQGGDDMQHAVHVDSGDTPVQDLQPKVFLLCAPVVTVRDAENSGTQGNRQIDRRRKARGRGLEGASNRFRAPFVLQRLP